MRRSDAGFLIVTGPGRSGTSAVARVLHESGIPMGGDLAPASQHNPVGFYEEVPVCMLNEAIFDDCGMDDSIDHWPSRSAAISAALPYRPVMQGLVEASTARGWKDPRFSLTLEAWLPYLPERPRVIICLRSPEAFVQSTVSIFGLSPREPLEAWWANHLRRTLDVVADFGLEATSVVYEDLITRPAATVAKLSSFVGQELEPAFVEPQLRQFAHDVPQRHTALYDEVRALSMSSV